MPCRFSLDRADRFAVNEKRVVGLAGLERQLAQRDPARRGKIRSAFVLHRPTALLKQRIDFLPGEFFWGRHGCKEYGVALLRRVNFQRFYAI